MDGEPAVSGVRWVFEEGDRLVTVAASGKALEWEVQANGLLLIVAGTAGQRFTPRDSELQDAPRDDKAPPPPNHKG